jgi:hypothetical protein
MTHSQFSWVYSAKSFRVDPFLICFSCHFGVVFNLSLSFCERSKKLISEQKMRQNQNIIPWKCHVCGNEFGTMGGGICKECGKATCHGCFIRGGFKSLRQFKSPKAGVCRLCAERNIIYRKKK